MAPVKDPFAEFKGKQKLTESEVNLMLRRLNSEKIKPTQLREGGYALTPAHIAKGRKWLMNLWRTPTGAERKNNPFGYREEAVLETLQSIRLEQVVNTSAYRSPYPFYVPVYTVIGKDNMFMYYVSGGKINIVG